MSPSRACSTWRGPNAAAEAGVDGATSVSSFPDAELTRSGRDTTLRWIPLPGAWAFRHTVLLARDGEQGSPAIAAVIAAVHKTSAKFGYLT
jgi:hypothetical protein